MIDQSELVELLEIQSRLNWQIASGLRQAFRSLSRINLDVTKVTAGLDDDAFESIEKQMEIIHSTSESLIDTLSECAKYKDLVNKLTP